MRGSSTPGYVASMSGRGEYIGDVLVQLMDRKGLTPQELHETSGVSYNHIINLRQGNKRASASTMRKLATALGVAVARTHTTHRPAPRPVVRIVQGSPALVVVWDESPAPHVAYSTAHALTARVWAASAGRRWDVVAWWGWDRNRFLTGARLVLDGEGYEAVREGERVLEVVCAEVSS